MIAYIDSPPLLSNNRDYITRVLADLESIYSPIGCSP